MDLVFLKLFINYLERCIYYLKIQDQVFVINSLSYKIKKAFIDYSENKTIEYILENMDNDDIINLLDCVSKEGFSKVLKFTDKIDRDKIWEILKYNKDFAGSIMSNNFLAFKANDTIKSALKKIKDHCKNHESDNYYYIVDNTNKLIGRVSLKKLFFFNQNKKINDIIEKISVSIDVLEDKENTSNTFKKFRINEAPVINSQEKLLGVIYYDEVFDVLQEEVSEDFQKIMAIDPFKESYIDAPIKKIVRSRIFWLIILLFSATLSQVVIQSLQHIIASSHVRHYFQYGVNNLATLYAIDALIPLISGTAGNTGSQSSTTIIRGIAMEQIKTSDYLKVLRKEISTAVFIGGLLIIVNAIRMPIYDIFYNGLSSSHFWGLYRSDYLIILAISISLFFTVCISQVVGVSLPIIIRKFRKDPSVMSAPLITTFIDALCNGITYSICILVFVLLGTI